MADFSPIVRRMKLTYSLRVRRWRRHMSGCAWRVTYNDGRCVNWIEAPFPKTPISLAIFLHEVGHHAIGFDGAWPRCQEEHLAWRWALDQMRRLGVTPDQRTLNRVRLSMQYAVDQAMRGGLKRLPAPLRQYLPAA